MGLSRPDLKPLLHLLYHFEHALGWYFVSIIAKEIRHAPVAGWVLSSRACESPLGTTRAKKTLLVLHVQSFLQCMVLFSILHKDNSD